MKFGFTPDEAQWVARAVLKYVRKRGVTVKIERAPWRDAPYRPTIVATEAGKTTLVEAQGAIAFTTSPSALAKTDPSLFS